MYTRWAILSSTVLVLACGDQLQLRADADTDSVAEARLRPRCQVQPDPSVVGQEYLVLAEGLLRNKPVRLVIQDAAGSASVDGVADRSGTFKVTARSSLAGAGTVAAYSPLSPLTLQASCSFQVEAASPDPEPPACGDGTCDQEEDCTSCAADCDACAPEELCSEWHSQDLGAVTLAGSATCPAAGTMELTGSGADIWGAADAFHFLHQQVSGDWSLTARVASLSETNPWAKAGVMIRETLDADARHAHVLVSASAANPVKFDTRDAPGGQTSGVSGTLVAAPHWVRLERRGNEFLGYESADGQSWSSLGSRTVPMAEQVYIGLSLVSHDAGLLASARFEQVQLAPVDPVLPPPPPPPPTTTSDLGPLKAFPFAEGFGANNVHGRGGAILKVTNLNASGPGSLLAAIQATGPRVVVFEVGGLIDWTGLGAYVQITNPYIQIAGQTAPAPGITIRGTGIRVTTHDVVIRHIRLRTTNVGYTITRDANGLNVGIRDSLMILNGGNHAVFDHISQSWASNEGFSTWISPHNFTLSNSIIAENTLSGTDKHSMLLGDSSTDMSILRNLLVNGQSRNPLLKGGTTGIAINNVIHNMGGAAAFVFTDDYNNGPSLFSIVGNVASMGPNSSTQYGVGLIQCNTLTKPGTQIFHSDNVFRSAAGASLPLWLYCPSAFNVAAPPISYAGVTVLPSAEVQAHVLAKAGARPLERDNVDQRSVEHVRNGTGCYPSTIDECGGMQVYASTSRPFATPTAPWADPDGNGWSTLEELLHQMHLDVTGP